MNTTYQTDGENTLVQVSTVQTETRVSLDSLMEQRNTVAANLVDLDAKIQQARDLGLKTQQEIYESN